MFRWFIHKIKKAPDENPALAKIFTYSISQKRRKY
nr:MAG TPA: hypothetical protein [Caudoviricetes sp.]